MMRMRVVLTTITLIASLTSFAAYSLLLKYLGTSERVDMLFYASSIPISLAGITSGVLLYLLPPRFTQLASRHQESTLRLLGLIVVLVTGMAMLFGMVCLLTQKSAVFWMLWIGFALTAGLSVLYTLMICLAQARGAYLLTGIAALIASTGLLVGVLAAISVQREWLLVVGQLTGAIAVVWWLARVLKLRVQMSLRRDRLIGSAALSSLRGHVVAILLGTTAFTLFPSIDAALCTQLGNGSVSIMAYAQRVLVALGTAVSLGAYAIAARTSHDTFRAGGHVALCRQANRETLRVVIFGLVVWLGYEIVGKNILSMILSSTAMSGEDLTRLLECLHWMLLGVGPMAAMPYLFRVFYSLNEYRKPAVLGICIAPGYGALAWVLLNRFEIRALPIAYATVWWLVLAATVIWLNGAPRESTETY